MDYMNEDLYYKTKDYYETLLPFYDFKKDSRIEPFES